MNNKVIKMRHWATGMKCLMESLGFAETWLNQLDNIPNSNIISEHKYEISFCNIGVAISTILLSWNIIVCLKHLLVLKSIWNALLMMNFERVLLLLGSQHIIWKLNVGDIITFQEI